MFKTKHSLDLHGTYTPAASSQTTKPRQTESSKTVLPLRHFSKPPKGPTCGEARPWWFRRWWQRPRYRRTSRRAVLTVDSVGWLVGWWVGWWVGGPLKPIQLKNMTCMTVDKFEMPFHQMWTKPPPVVQDLSNLHWLINRSIEGMRILAQYNSFLIIPHIKKQATRVEMKMSSAHL